jgi:hypothetical protein
MMRALPLIVLLTGCAAEAPDYAAVFDGRAGRWVDLTHAFSESTIYWPTDTAGFRLDTLAMGPTPGGWLYASYAMPRTSPASRTWRTWMGAVGRFGSWRSYRSGTGCRDAASPAC